MILEASDIPIIEEALQGYQWWVENFPGYHLDAIVRGPMRPIEKVREFQARRARIECLGPLVARALAGELPDGFNVLKTIDNQCLAWCHTSRLGIEGPVTEFQARLWCLKNSTLKDEVDYAY